MCSQRDDRVAYGKGKLSWTRDTISFAASTELQKCSAGCRSHQPYWLSTPGINVFLQSKVYVKNNKTAQKTHNAADIKQSRVAG